MCNTVLKRWLLASALLVAVCTLALPAIAADQAQEIAARALLGEAEKLNELARPFDALPILDKVQAQYPGTEAALYAELRRAYCFLYLQRYDDALSTAEAIVQANPSSVIGAWAQCVIGDSLVHKKQYLRGAQALMQVEDMLPDMKDTGPLDDAKGIMARAYNEYLHANPGASTDMAMWLGVGSAKTKAKALAALAAGFGGRIDLCNPILEQMKKECPQEKAELEGAQMRLAVGYLKKHPDGGEFLPVIENMVLGASASASPDDMAKAKMVLAQCYRNRGNNAEAITLLQEASVSDREAQSRPAVLFELGNLLCEEGRGNEARETLISIADVSPHSGYVAPALYCAGQYADQNLDGIDALMRLAQGNYSLRWRGLAYWKLGGLYKSSDKVKAREAYQQALSIFKQVLAEQKADAITNWQDLMRQRIALIESELAVLDLLQNGVK